MPKSSLFKSIKSDKKTSADNLRKQKFAIWNYYQKKENSSIIVKVIKKSK